ncbi:MAG TPA: hypothetical protein VHF69_10745 [Candidatus Synoicihabitans sp.]|nr:hypothetical protein [Candidatus Synoicihabitans sp.]
MLDRAVALHEPLRKFLRQDVHEIMPRETTFRRIQEVLK